jgi:iron complex transport system substrate-binding protein
MHHSFNRPLRPGWAALLLIIPLWLADPASAAAREVTDMSGQRLTVPEEIKSIYAMTHAMPLVAALAPDLLAGFAMPVTPKPEMLRFLPPSMAALPNLGGGQETNLEKLAASHINIALGWVSPNEQYPAKQMARINLPVINIEVDRLDQYPGSFRYLGRLLHREARGEALAHALEEATSGLAAAIKDVPAPERPKVYYAESVDGLVSQCDASPRTEAIVLAGGLNALSCDGLIPAKGSYPIDIEKLLDIDPDVIVTRFAGTAKAIRADPRWAQLKAVKAGRVWSVPAYPFNWFDRPPSFMRIMGARWLAAKLHPGRYTFDERGETKRFYALFFGVTPGDADLDLLFSQ